MVETLLSLARVITRQLKRFCLCIWEMRPFKISGDSTQPGMSPGYCARALIKAALSLIIKLAYGGVGWFWDSRFLAQDGVVSYGGRCYLPSPPMDVTHDSRLFILNTVVALSSLSGELLLIKQLALYKAPGRAQGTRGPLTIQSKLYRR